VTLFHRLDGFPAIARVSPFHRLDGRRTLHFGTRFIDWEHLARASLQRPRFPPCMLQGRPLARRAAWARFPGKPPLRASLEGIACTWTPNLRARGAWSQPYASPALPLPAPDGLEAEGPQRRSEPGSIEHGAAIDPHERARHPCGRDLPNKQSAGCRKNVETRCKVIGSG
jgi:hypothetical protein